MNRAQPGGGAPLVMIENRNSGLVYEATGAAPGAPIARALPTVRPRDRRSR